MKTKVPLIRQITAILIAWLIFIGLDFLFHAGLLEKLWNDPIPAIKSPENLAILIPAGYGSFLLLTGLIGFVFHRFFTEKPTLKKVMYFALLFGSLFSLSNLLGLYSFVAIPLKKLILINFVYFIEIITVSLTLYYITFSSSLKRSIWFAVLIFFILLILGILFQNLL